MFFLFDYNNVCVQKSIRFKSWRGNLICNRRSRKPPVYVNSSTSVVLFHAFSYLGFVFVFAFRVCGGILGRDWLLFGCLISDLRGNRLSGQIPDEIGDCSALQNMYFLRILPEFILTFVIFNAELIECFVNGVLSDLSFNEIFGDIPFSISKLKQLENL